MNEYGKMDFSVSFNPTSAFPLDARCEFDSYDTALAAAKTAGEVGNKESKYYYGMILTVHGETVQKYVIKTDGTLELLGTGAGGGECDWNKMQNKPFYDEMGSVAGHWQIPPEVSFEYDGTWYQIIDQVPSEEQLQNATLYVAVGDQTLFNGAIQQDALTLLDENVSIFIWETGAMLFVRKAGDYAVNAETTVHIPAEGVYLACNYGDAWKAVNVSISWNYIKTLDAKYLPVDAIDARIDAYMEEALGGEY